MKKFLLLMLALTPMFMAEGQSGGCPVTRGPMTPIYQNGDGALYYSLEFSACKDGSPCAVNRGLFGFVRHTFPSDANIWLFVNGYDCNGKNGFAELNPGGNLAPNTTVECGKGGFGHTLKSAGGIKQLSITYHKGKDLIEIYVNTAKGVKYYHVNGKTPGQNGTDPVQTDISGNDGTAYHSSGGITTNTDGNQVPGNPVYNTGNGYIPPPPATNTVSREQALQGLQQTQIWLNQQQSQLQQRQEIVSNGIQQLGGFFMQLQQQKEQREEQQRAQQERWQAEDRAREAAALRTTIQAAAGGNVNAQFQLGMDYLNGKSTLLKNISLAAYWFSQAAGNGDVNAQRALGDLYLVGYGAAAGDKGIQKDYNAAAYWYQKAAIQGDPVAQNALAAYYYNLKRDFQQAVYWCRRAAAGGNANAQFNLGLCYETGRGLPKDNVQAADWYNKAIQNKGPKSADLCLGYLYEAGLGVSKDYGEAAKWYYYSQSDDKYDFLSRMYFLSREKKISKKEFKSLYSIVIRDKWARRRWNAQNKRYKGLYEDKWLVVHPNDINKIKAETAVATGNANRGMVIVRSGAY